MMRAKKTLFHTVITYIVFANGKVKISYKVSPTDIIKNIQSLPRVGLKCSINSALTKISYLGRGPFENYPDRKSESDMGRWITSPSKMHVDYIVPGENGNRSDCKWISFEDESGPGLRIEADLSVSNSLSFSAQLYSPKELEIADHTTDLPERIEGLDPIHMNIDHAIMGVAGDNSWSPCVYPEYEVKGKDCFAFSVWLLPK